MSIKGISLEDELKKKTGITPQDIQKLRDWLGTQPHLPGDYITDMDLALIYHCCDRSAEVSKQVLDLHYTLRTLFTSFFKDRVMDDKIEKNLQYVLLQPLQTRSREDDAVLYCRLLDYEPKNFDFAKSLRLVLMILDLWQFEEGTWPGFVLIFDLDGLKLGHLAKLDVQSIQQFLYYLQEAMLVKVRGLHFLNAPSFMDRLMMMIKPFMKKELIDVLLIHQIGAKTLDKHVPMAGLPKGAGGEFKSFDELRDETIARLKANKQFFVEENKKRVVEAKRPGKPKTISDIFGGVEGSFKKLDID
ncbi:clavesin-1-like [Trichoplusia ni]|uniref:Clavesin-1-like n=1 Tax=Trichoplusia ni TaxID=7111 RepID=A0A7E5WI09_TRINI|nr:clavesin-1-like [Trichoplusia ni]XP_026740324.1 clavesin-1-like [Trichoplusia ni]XP_026740325.1 clavesin-1-like [Trichoplusia ni]XP_026740398.1 clavesin-1-like [Trichoplusia ni]XP_026740399.1 clavesin-1-like [Trichoplusia ni]XP_026740400.1 clavesin-1-like [Trichoplusia ni]